jgi:hypothetical protein
MVRVPAPGSPGHRFVPIIIILATGIRLFPEPVGWYGRVGCFVKPWDRKARPHCGRYVVLASLACLGSVPAIHTSGVQILVLAERWLVKISVESLDRGMYILT